MDLDDAIPVCHDVYWEPLTAVSHVCHARAQDYQGHLWEMWLRYLLKTDVLMVDTLMGHVFLDSARGCVPQ